jgi:hypothetical protein
MRAITWISLFDDGLHLLPHFSSTSGPVQKAEKGLLNIHYLSEKLCQGLYSKIHLFSTTQERRQFLASVTLAVEKCN